MSDEKSKNLDAHLDEMNIKNRVPRSPFPCTNMDKMMRSATECRREVEGVIKGTIPPHVYGSLIRVGPAKWDLSSGFTLNYWLDGCAFMMKFTFSKDRVVFTSRFLESDAYKKMMSHGRPVFTEFGTRAYPDKDKNFFSRFVGSIVPSDLTDNDVSNVYKIKDRLFLATESCNIWNVDGETLESIEKVNLDKHCKVAIACSHPLVSESEGVIYNVGTTFMTGMKHHLLKIPLDKKSVSQSPADAFKNAQIVTTFSSSYKTSFAFMHSFFMTEHYIIIPEQPFLCVGTKLATSTFKGKALNECMEWHPEEPTRFHVINKANGVVSRVKYHAAPILYFHVANAYEEGSNIVMDLIAFKDPSVLDNYQLSYMRDGEWNEANPGAPTRFVLPLDIEAGPIGENLLKIPGCSARAEKTSNGVVWLHPEQLGPPGFELPRINEKHCLAKFHRFIYGAGGFDRGYYDKAVCKVDVTTKTPTLWRDTSTAYPGEPIFVPRPGGTDEDDGSIIVVVIETDETKPQPVVILNAKTMKEECRIEFPRGDCQIMASIHGIHLPSQDGSS